MPVSMSRLHAREIRQSEVPHVLSVASSTHDPSKEKQDTEFRNLFGYVPELRIVQFPDRKLKERSQWLSKVTKTDDIETVSLSIDIYHAQSRKFFSTIIISGDDFPRMAPMIKEIRRSLPSKIILALVSESDPWLFSQLLRLGCDDVLSTKMLHKEGRCRIAAHERRLIWSRQRQSKEAKKRRREEARELAVRRCLVRDVSPQEFRVLRLLMNNAGKVVRHSKLMREASCREKETGRQGLNVVICRLRASLKNTIKIETVRNVGYTLHINENVIDDREKLLSEVGSEYENDFNQFLYDEELNELFQRAAAE